MNVLLILGAGVLGAVFGSFFNCVINAEQRRPPTSRGAPPAAEQSRNHAEIEYKLDFLFRRSACPKCGHKLGFWDLLPVLSFIFLRGHCRYCRQKISWQYPIVEIVTALLFIFVAYSHLSSSSSSLLSIVNSQGSVVVIRDLFFVSFLLLIFIFDLKYGIIPDRVSIPAIVLAIGFNIFLIFAASPSVIPAETGTQISRIFLAILIGGGFFLAQYLISKGKWVGGGDVRLGALMGAMLSWPNVLIALFLAYVAGAIYGIAALILKKKTLQSAVPFGTFLAASTFITLFYGANILSWYLTLLNY